MQGLFGLKTPKDLLQKLEREYVKLQANRTDDDTAWNFFATADTLPDWLARSDPKSLEGHGINTFKRSNPLLRICENLANGAKHFVPHVKTDDKRNISVDKTGSEMRSYIAKGYIQDGYFADEPMLMVYLTRYEVTEFKKIGYQDLGTEIEVPWLATQVIEFWRNHIKP